MYIAEILDSKAEIPDNNIKKPDNKVELFDRSIKIPDSKIKTFDSSAEIPDNDSGKLKMIMGFEDQW